MSGQWIAVLTLMATVLVMLISFGAWITSWVRARNAEQSQIVDAKLGAVQTQINSLKSGVEQNRGATSQIREEIRAEMGEIFKKMDGISKDLHELIGRTDARN